MKTTTRKAFSARYANRSAKTAGKPEATMKYATLTAYYTAAAAYAMKTANTIIGPETVFNKRVWDDAYKFALRFFTDSVQAPATQHLPSRNTVSRS